MSELYHDRFDSYRGVYVEVGASDGLVELSIPSQVALTPDEARRLARSLNRVADQLEP